MTGADPPPLNFWEHAQRHPTDVALIDEQERCWTAAELLAAVNRVSHGLLDRGIGRGDVVATLLPKRAELLVVWLATTQIGAYLVTLNPYALDDVRHVLASSRPRLVVLDASTPHVLEVVHLCHRMGSFGISIGATLDGCLSFETAFGAYPDSRPAARTAGALLTYTSGTTGRPRGVLRPLPVCAPEQIYRSLILWFLRTFGVVPRSSGVHLCACPLHHAGPLLFASYALHVGHAVALPPAWHARIVLRWIEQYRVTTSFMVPSQFVSLLKLPVAQRERHQTGSLQSLIHGSAPCPDAIKRAMISWLGPKLYDCYGATEVGGTVASSQEWLAFPGTVGRASPPHEVRVYREDGAIAPPGTVGEIYLRAIPENEFSYKDDAPGTAACRRGSFVSVGDIGYLNDSGYLFLVGRKTDLIKCRGEKVFPAPIEAALIAHPAVADCAVFGVPHAEYGEAVRAVVCLVNRTQASADLTSELLRYLRARLAPIQCPEDIDFVDELPRDGAGKLRRRNLQESIREMS